MDKPQSIDVVVLAGGLGKRLQSVVNDRPKPMALVNGEPFLSLLVDHVASFGYQRFFLCAGYMADSIESFFDSARQSHKVVVIREDKPLGTAGALKHAAKNLRSGSILVLNGDSFCPVDYGAMFEAHRRRSAQVTIAATPAKDKMDYGSIATDDDGRILKFSEKTGMKEDRLVNAGVYIFERTVIDAIDNIVPLSLEKDIFPRLAGGGLFAYRCNGPLLDIGTPERYAIAQKELVGLMKKSSEDRG